MPSGIPTICLYNLEPNSIYIFHKIMVAQDPNFRNLQNFGLPYMIMARSFDACFA